MLDLVFGTYSETSDGVKKNPGPAGGVPSVERPALALGWAPFKASKEMSQVTDYFRRRVSSAIMRANVKCLLDRLLLVGEGQGQAGRRRQWARRGAHQAG